VQVQQAAAEAIQQAMRVNQMMRWLGNPLAALAQVQAHL